MQLLERITRKIDAAISIYTRLDNEFLYMIRLTKSYKSLSNTDGLGDVDVRAKAKLSWATLHSLLHSERPAYRQNAYIWLVELLLSEISKDGQGSIWLNIKRLQQHIADAGNLDLSCSSIPLPVCMLCGLLKSKHNYIKWGFLFVLEKLLVRCKLLLDESELQYGGHEDRVSHDSSGNRLNKANAIIDIMSCALFLLVQFIETDHISILKVSAIHSFVIETDSYTSFGVSTMRSFAIVASSNFCNLHYIISCLYQQCHHGQYFVLVFTFPVNRI